MGFWDGMKRMIDGKPVFEVPPTSSSEPQASSTSQPAGEATVDSSGRKIIPQIAISHVDSNLNGSSLEVWATIQNSSPVPIFLDKIYFLGQKYELDRELSPGASYQYRVYRGQVPTTKPSNDADVDYRIQSNGDYFRARFYVEYDLQNGQYLPEQFHLEGPVRDI